MSCGASPPCRPGKFWPQISDFSNWGSNLPSPKKLGLFICYINSQWENSAAGRWKRFWREFDVFRGRNLFLVCKKWCFSSVRACDTLGVPDFRGLCFRQQILHMHTHTTAPLPRRPGKFWPQLRDFSRKLCNTECNITRGTSDTPKLKYASDTSHRSNKIITDIRNSKTHQTTQANQTHKRQQQSQQTACTLQ